MNCTRCGVDWNPNTYSEDRRGSERRPDLFLCRDCYMDWIFWIPLERLAVAFEGHFEGHFDGLTADGRVLLDQFLEEGFRG